MITDTISYTNIIEFIEYPRVNITGHVQRTLASKIILVGMMSHTCVFTNRKLLVYDKNCTNTKSICTNIILMTYWQQYKINIMHGVMDTPP